MLDKKSQRTQGAELGLDSNLADDRVCLDALESARKQDYAGYSKFDALNSPLLKSLSVNNRWLRLFFIQFVNHCPWHLRPALGVQKSCNAKGIALFVRAYLFLWSLTGDAIQKNEAHRLLQWLQENRAVGSKHPSWGYNFVWQSTILLQNTNEPNCVVSVFVGEAFLQAHTLFQREEYLHVAKGVARFIMEELPVLQEGDEEKAIGYVLRGNKSIVLNINVLAGAFLAKVWDATQDDSVLDFAQKLLAFTVNRRTAYDAWYYTDPRGKSPITHDNYHTGGILDGLLEYVETTGDTRYEDVYWRGLDYYRQRLFEDDGAPRWMNDQKYPHDVHGAAQGIISFAKAARHRHEYFKDAKRIASWAITNLYRPKTRDFAYRQGRFVKWNYSLMRWCNAWMTRALAELALVER